ncbi:urease accessory protein UreF [Calothrix sp. 336/3]|uniref:urease accessory protein UreF n=1 Tax=Calothrix sp. 336/3 TaxID=1337936 RepID=UPI00062463E2|nr:urease accessory protein UreF [Calothrix sp. 336/3]AKG22977.1 urease accessory protein UreF [Calothrix sp. 336/3]
MDTIINLDIPKNSPSTEILYLLQLSSPALPVGAYSYSEGLETLVENAAIHTEEQLARWIQAELQYGTISMEGAVMVRAYQAIAAGDLVALADWNSWLSATRETTELRNSSWGMGRSLIRLLLDVEPEITTLTQAVGNPCNYAIAFAIAATHWQINIQLALQGYLQSWASNLVTAGVKLIPLGQTAGQRILLSIYPLLSQTVIQILNREDDELCCCSWGLSLASMQHETQYTRLFRS